jgi:hypothetical protein
MTPSTGIRHKKIGGFRQHSVQQSVMKIHRLFRKGNEQTEMVLDFEIVIIVVMGNYAIFTSKLKVTELIFPYNCREEAKNKPEMVVCLNPTSHLSHHN